MCLLIHKSSWGNYFTELKYVSFKRIFNRCCLRLFCLENKLHRYFNCCQQSHFFLRLTRVDSYNQWWQRYVKVSNTNARCCFLDFFIYKVNLTKLNTYLISVAFIKLYSISTWKKWTNKDTKITNIYNWIHSSIKSS